jgi:hypothetical protein
MFLTLNSSPSSIPTSALRAAAFMIMIPFACADETSNGPTVGSAIWQLLRLFEITNIIIAVGGAILGLIILTLLWRTYRYSRACFQMCKALVNDIDIPEYRR